MNSGACGTCGAALGYAEPDPCGACAELHPWGAWLGDHLYKVACGVSRPLKKDDYYRLASLDADHFDFAPTSTVVTLANDFRFCWAGRGLYGLARHGLVPGPRKLAAAGRLIIYAADASVSNLQLEFVLKRIGYRFELGSLVGALRRHPNWITEAESLRFDVDRGPRLQHRLRAELDPNWPRARFESDLYSLGERVRGLLGQRDRLNREPPDLRHLDDDWVPS